ncbi:uncharacterized protein [Nicotiana tomentosiformis]|uniref:Uncharacterized protein isoform X1 n=1 Tax=Nicotiana tabacum TaxID=4097 RepID=A0A1S3ZXM3_TOBAC|nr:uncharacterized protein LOC104089239 isoform X1 [Nicotiana tomentosiformis]XP_016469094.1 PREDICTED: uncharacterized protein LOC107791522 isoform X1 [Nicotiana tabacum]
MDIRLSYRNISSHGLWSCRPRTQKGLKPCCSGKDSQQNGDSNNNKNPGDKFSTDWDKAWSSFRKQSKKNFFSQFSPNKYVTWNPKRSEYPLSEEVDPIKRAEKSNLMLWTSPQFTLVGAIIIVTFLLVYSILAITK